VVGDGTGEYVFGPAGLQQRTVGSASQYAQGDGLGSVRLITDGSGAAAGSATFEPWGAPKTGSATLGGFGFTGEQADAETGFVYLRARYYDPTTGRFIERDNYPGTINSPVSLNSYTYAHDNPVRFTDPSGLWTIGPCVGGSLGAAIFGTTNACFVVASNGDIGIVYAVGFSGTGEAAGTAQVQLQASSGSSISDLLGPFGTVGGSAGEVIGFSFDLFAGKTSDCPSSRVVGGQVGVGPTIRVPLPFEIHGGVSTTYPFVVVNVPTQIRNFVDFSQQYALQWIQSNLPGGPPFKQWWER